jgi:hypothetical protein
LEDEEEEEKGGGEEEDDEKPAKPTCPLSQCYMSTPQCQELSISTLRLKAFRDKEKKQNQKKQFMTLFRNKNNNFALRHR